MNELLTAKEIKDNLSLVNLLARMGFYPARKSGKEHYYISMLRDPERTPSFCVDDNLGVWFDAGIGKGGNIIDFSIAYWKHLSFQEVLVKIQELCEGTVIIKPTDNNTTRRRHAVKLPYYKVAEVKELGNNPAITEYLKERGVWETAQGRVKEVYYYVEDEKKLRKNFFAAGWQNETAGWEVRNKYFKGCVGNKAITIIPADTGHLVVFEGYINYLSWLTEHPLSTATVLVLNSISFLRAAISIAANYETIDLYFDRDKTGHEATLAFQKDMPRATDRSMAYEHYNDYNDRVKATIKARDQPEVSIFRNTFSR
ncbi:toprim domain-containing protein [Mucilaginibacter sp. FT3.2]|uniref:toprim domain-containing protein n=1 Tax=Mucilaginibacter sp. FT3.2 TaxID=2723090 RepID=UPI0016070CEB|nr:toprim domain-containing protein [Mucilaginibacter sp. FT3.2]MBB6234261.1 DNA primase [Mucilaginibacter sp. FT3.2]